MIIKQQHWVWHSVGFRIIQPISALLTYHTVFLLIIIIMECVLTYLNYSIVKIKYISRS